MLIYWLIFLFLALLALSGRDAQRLDHFRFNSRDFILVSFISIILVLFIGLRHNVGADWGSYLYYNKLMGFIEFSELNDLGDPGYHLFNFLSYNLGIGVYGVNLVCSIIFVLGLLKFCSTLQRPFLSLVCSFPYLVIVVSMGYTRQSVAISLIMLALSVNRLFWVFFFAVLAVSFHKSALIMIPVLMFAYRRKTAVIASIAFVVVILFLFASGQFDKEVDIYIKREYDSGGALVRILMCFFPSLLFFWRRNLYLAIDIKRYYVWLLMSVASVVVLIMYFLLPGSSTFLDRISLYLLPLQLFVFSGLPNLLSVDSAWRFALVMLVIFFYAAILGVWLLAANNAGSWIPYDSAFLHMGEF